MEEVKTRGKISPEKIQTNWRILRKVVNALQADADKQGFTSIPALLNCMLTLHYFGDKKLRIPKEE